MTRHRLNHVVRISLAGVPALALALACAPHAALADDEDPQQAQAQAPDPGVARVSVIEGGVDVKRGDSGDTVSADVNAPLSPGDYVSTQDDSHAEIDFDYGTELRVASDTQLRFTQLLPDDHELQLAAGTIDIRLFHGDGANTHVETPQATISPAGNGSTLVNVDNDGNTQVTVRSGSAEVESNAGTQTLVPGSTLAISGDVDHPQLQTLDPIGETNFDHWIASRDRYAESSQDNPYVADGMVGAGDLDANGRWVDNAQYGRVWVPAVEAGWAPYHDGRWVWEPYYGWTWVDREPWGWAPFHYGNWFYAADVGWAWYPGPRAVERPYVYRPALVAFFSFGGGEGGVSFDFGNVGWVPLAPNEPFHPWWGSGSGYGGGAYGYRRRPQFGGTTIVNNYTNNTTIVNVYHNSNAPGGIVGIANGSFANGNFNHLRTLQPADLRGAEPIRGVVPIVPTQNNLSFREHESAIRPITPVARFQNFASPQRGESATFARQQESVKSLAARNYPRHAEEFTRAVPASREGEAHPAYGSPDRGGVEAPRQADPAYAKPAPANDGAAPFDRFDRPNQSAPAARTAPDGAPAYRTPSAQVEPSHAYGTTPVNRTPRRVPGYRTYRHATNANATTRAPRPAGTAAPR